MSDLSMKIIIIVGSSLLIVAAILTAVVANLLFKVSKVLKDEKEPDPEADCARIIKDKVFLAEPTTTECCPIVRPCDECEMYADPLPPCFCEINERR